MLAFTSAEVRRITGISTMQINHWDRLGIAKPSVRAAEGCGSRRLYSIDDLIAVEIAHQLRAVNIGLECLAVAMSHLRAIWPSRASMARVVLIRPDGSCETFAKGSDPAALLAGHRAGLILDLAGAIRGLQARLQSTPAVESAEPAAELPPSMQRSQASAWGEDW